MEDSKSDEKPYERYVEKFVFAQYDKIGTIFILHGIGFLVILHIKIKPQSHIFIQ